METSTLTRSAKPTIIRARLFPGRNETTWSVIDFVRVPTERIRRIVHRFPLSLFLLHIHSDCACRALPLNGSCTKGRDVRPLLRG